MIYISRFFLKIFDKLRKVYLRSNIYDKKISNINHCNLTYKPSPHLLSSLIKYQKKKFNINEISVDSLWTNHNIHEKNFKKIHNFYWFFSLDLKSSKKKTQNIILKWIENNYRYNSKSWEFDLTSKRIISWLSNHSLTYSESDKNYQDEFNKMIQKQTNHLINVISKSELADNRMIGCAAIILVGLSYKEQKKYLEYGLILLKKIIKSSLDSHGFPKSRNIKQIVFYLKYLILIREWFKESQVPIPEQIDETIYYLGQGYAFTWQNIGIDVLLNGNNISSNAEFDHYLKRFGYKFKNEDKEFGGYAIIKNKKISLIMDVGPSPINKFSKDYQSGALSFEINSNGRKLITNCGYYDQRNPKLNRVSKSSASHNTLIIDDNSSCNFEKIKGSNTLIKNGLKTFNKNTILEKNYWMIKASHNGYQKKYSSIHERKIEFYTDEFKFIGTDRILNKKTSLNIKFEIRFHLHPDTKLMKTQDNKTILIELKDEGWKFTCNNFDINVDNGLFFGNKNFYIPNQNIFISGITNKQNENIVWELTKI